VSFAGPPFAYRSGITKQMRCEASDDCVGS
jgi:hypothetical protein